MHGPPSPQRRDEPGPTAAPTRQRSEGQVALTVARLGGADRVVALAESGPIRLRFPRGPALEAVLLNTAGGIACGDRLAVSLRVEAGASLVATTTAAEKVYRSDGATTMLSVDLAVGAGAELAWLPQETILYDGARLDRRLDVELAPDGRLLLFEALVFGRIARGERLRQGRVVDRWRVRRGGRLVFAEGLRLEGAVADLLDRPTTAAGAGALATMLLVAPDAEARLEEARALLDGASCEVAASAWSGLLAARFLAPDAGRLRRAAIRLVEGLRGRPMPRVWQT